MNKQRLIWFSVARWNWSIPLSLFTLDVNPNALVKWWVGWWLMSLSVQDVEKWRRFCVIDRHQHLPLSISLMKKSYKRVI